MDISGNQPEAVTVQQQSNVSSQASKNWVKSPHTKTGCVLIVIAYLNMLMYFPQGDSQYWATLEGDGFKASAALKFISFITMQTAVVFCMMMLFYKSYAFKWLTVILTLFSEMAMAISLIVFTAETCKATCPKQLDYKVGMLSIGVAIGCIGAFFLLSVNCIDHCLVSFRACCKQCCEPGSDPYGQRHSDMERIITRYNQTHHTRVELVHPNQQQILQQQNYQQPPPQYVQHQMQPQHAAAHQQLQMQHLHQHQHDSATQQDYPLPQQNPKMTTQENYAQCPREQMPAPRNDFGAGRTEDDVGNHGDVAHSQYPPDYLPQYDEITGSQMEGGHI